MDSEGMMKDLQEALIGVLETKRRRKKNSVRRREMEEVDVSGR